MNAKNNVKPAGGHDERLKNALRANLKRRKQQARQRVENDVEEKHPVNDHD